MSMNIKFDVSLPNGDFIAGSVNSRYKFWATINQKSKLIEIKWEKEPLKKSKAEKRIKELIKKLGENNE